MAFALALLSHNSCCPTADCGYVFVWEKGDSSDFGCEKCKKRLVLYCLHMNLFWLGIV